MNPRKIAREEIAQLHFTSTEVLHDQNQISKREHDLGDAMVLGNLEKQKCKIIFHADEGDCCVETTVWAVTDKYVWLKGGLTLVIASIIEVII